ncbi:MAG: DNA gyrase subunit A, partial [Aestuariivirgaceae bacterium]
MNVLSQGRVPKVMSLRDVLREWLDHRQVVLVRRTQFRLEQIARRLEILGGYLIAYLNLDEVIRIIREEDEPKQELMQRFELNDVQAEAILNMLLRAVRKLEEIEIRKEHEGLTEEQGRLNALMASNDEQWNTISAEIRETRDKYGKKTELGRRRTDFAIAPEVDVDLEQAMIDKEPVTVVCSEKCWTRSMKGHLEDVSTLAFKEGDTGRYALHAQTTDKLLLLASSGKFYTLDVNKLPGGRGHGEPLRLMVDIDAADAVAALFVHSPDRRLLVASSDGYGFVVNEADCIANTRKGKQVLNVKLPTEAQVCAFVSKDADHVAVVGENRKMLIFAMSELPEM